MPRHLQGGLRQAQVPDRFARPPTPTTTPFRTSAPAIATRAPSTSKKASGSTAAPAGFPTGADFLHLSGTNCQYDGPVFNLVQLHLRWKCGEMETRVHVRDVLVRLN